MTGVIKAMVLMGLGAVLGDALGSMLVARLVVARVPVPINTASIRVELARDLRETSPTAADHETETTSAQSAFTDAPLGMRLQHFDTWVRERPADVIQWLLGGEAHSAGLSDVEFRSRLSVALNVLRASREEEAFTRRKAWTGAPDQTFELSESWRKDGGNALRTELENNPRTTDLLWLVADADPALSFSDTAEWIATSPGDPDERARIVEQLARRSFDADKFLDFAVVSSEKQDPVFDRAKALLVAETIEASPDTARMLWESMPQSSFRLLAAVDVLSRASLSPEAKQRMLAWADPKWRKTIVALVPSK